MLRVHQAFLILCRCCATTFNGEVNPTLFRFVFVSHKVNFYATSFPRFSPTRPYGATEGECRRENLGTRLNFYVVRSALLNII